MICTFHCCEKTLAVEFELLIYVALSNWITIFLILITVRYVIHILKWFRFRQFYKVALVYKTRTWERISYNKVKNYSSAKSYMMQHPDILAENLLLVIFGYFSLKIYLFTLSVCVCVGVWLEARGQLAGVPSLLLPCEAQELNLVC